MIFKATRHTKPKDKSQGHPYLEFREVKKKTPEETEKPEEEQGRPGTIWGHRVGVSRWGRDKLLTVDEVTCQHLY